MKKREYSFDVTLDEANLDIDDLRKILEHHHPGEVPYYAPHRLTWCINDIATRCLVLAIGKCKHIIYTEVANQAIPQNWDWIETCFGEENIRLLAEADAKYILKRMLEEATAK